MLNIECKQCHKNWHHDNSRYCSMCGKKLAQQSEFKVGDYLTETSGNILYIAQVESISGDQIYADWYVPRRYGFSSINLCDDSEMRTSTPEEIAEYKVALNFREHGRKPFEVKTGDLCKTKKGLVFAVNNSSSDLNTKNTWLKNKSVLLKTAEEVGEWLKGENDE